MNERHCNTSNIQEWLSVEQSESFCLNLSNDTQVQTWNVISSVEKVIDSIENLRQSNHPRAKGLIEWIWDNEVNKNWCIRAIENKELALLEGWIMILWDVFDLEDVFLPDSELKEWINNDKWITYFDFDSAQLHAKKCWKNIPNDWTKYIDLLPWNEENKVNFLIKTLWLSFSGNRDWNNISFHNQWIGGFYWSSTCEDDSGYITFFYTTYIYSNTLNNKAYWFSLRLIKN